MWSGRRRFDESVVEFATLVRRQTNRLVSGRELDPLTFHFGFVTHDHHEMGPFLWRPEYTAYRRRPLSVPLPQPSFGRRFLAVSVHVRQHHDVVRCLCSLRARETTNIFTMTCVKFWVFKRSFYVNYIIAPLVGCLKKKIFKKLVSRERVDGRRWDGGCAVVVVDDFEFEIRSVRYNGRSAGARARFSADSRRFLEGSARGLCFGGRWEWGWRTGGGGAHSVTPVGFAREIDDRRALCVRVRPTRSRLPTLARPATIL